ncbi:MAG: TIGR03013 family PEP-CTERM/XrtA system glycosyltransferase [Motiliproteus sp.]|nr:TIGR03013 family PEP-CTERM/XrtA system glycosyltransferase [Motiliproteus sp.]MCW9052562.1 TIGR03013 family PEP-CTERM/XrtA system glycosyltransferase [Motiliproteus sp.]
MSTVRFNRLSVRKSYIFLALLESLAMMSCLFIGIVYSDNTFNSTFIDHFFCFECLTFVMVTFVCMAAMGLYHARLRGETTELLARVFLSFLLATITQALLFYFIPYLDIEPKAIGIALLLSFLIVCGLRYLFMHIDQTSLLKKRILVLGAGQRASIIHHKMRRDSDRRGFRLMGYVNMNDDETTICEENQLHVDLDHLDEYVTRYQIDEVVVAADQRRGKLPMEALYRCRIAGVNVIDVAGFVERESGKIPLKLMYPSWVIYGDGYRKTGIFARGLKRLFDISVGLIFVLLTWPLMLITVLLIKLESGPKSAVLYSQIRVGRGSENFKIYKFRSMREDAEKDGAVWAMQNDNRITVVGAFIRKYRIDELPQLFNILKGDMSFIGPRPERPEFVSDLSETIPYYGDRHQVKPGLTGWAQICYNYGSSEEDAMEKLQYDLYYIKNYTLLLDTIILIQTCEVIFFGKGAR